MHLGVLKIVIVMLVYLTGPIPYHMHAFEIPLIVLADLCLETKQLI